MNSAYEVNRIAQGFGQLASIFAPNTGALIEADMNRRKADNIDADTARTNVDATRLAADRDRLAALTAATEQQRLAAIELADIFASGADLSDPIVRGRAAAAVSKMDGGLQHGASGVTGLTTYVDPNFVPDNEDFSRVILGSGVVPDWASTPTGTMDAETNDLIINDADNASLEKRNQLDNETDVKIAEMGGSRGGSGTRNPPDVDPKLAGELADMLANSITNQFGVDVADMDPALVRELTSEATQAYQNRENAAVAIADVLAGLEVNADGEVVRAGAQPAASDTAQEGQGAGPTLGDSMNMVLAALIPALAPTTLTGPRGASAAAAPAQTGAAPDAPLTAVGPNGERIMLDPATNQWVPVGPRRVQ